MDAEELKEKVKERYSEIAYSDDPEIATGFAGLAKSEAQVYIEALIDIIAPMLSPGVTINIDLEEARVVDVKTIVEKVSGDHVFIEQNDYKEG